MLFFDPSSPHGLRSPRAPRSPRSPLPPEDATYPVGGPATDERPGNPGADEVGSKLDTLALQQQYEQRATLEFAMRDAAARFDETRRLAAELAMLQQQLQQSREVHEADQRRAGEREAALLAQLTGLQQEMRHAESQELVELGARAQVANWRATQAQKVAEEAEAERRRAVDALQTTESELMAARAELEVVQRAKEEVQAQARELSARESELSRSLAREREARAADAERMSSAVSTAVGDATSEAMAARQEAVELRHALGVEREVRIAAEARADAAQDAVKAAEERAAASSSSLQDEILRSERVKAETTERAETQVARSERIKEETLERIEALSHELEEQHAALATERQQAAERLESELQAAAEHLEAEQRAAADQLETELLAAAAQLEAERRASSERLESQTASAAETATDKVLGSISERAAGSLTARRCRRALHAWRGQQSEERRRQAARPYESALAAKRFRGGRPYPLLCLHVPTPPTLARALARTLAHPPPAPVPSPLTPPSDPSRLWILLTRPQSCEQPSSASLRRPLAAALCASPAPG